MGLLSGIKGTLSSGLISGLSPSGSQTAIQLVDAATGITHDDILIDGKSTTEGGTVLTEVGTVSLEQTLDGGVDGGGVTNGQATWASGSNGLRWGASDHQLDGTSRLFTIGFVCRAIAANQNLLGTREGSPFNGFEFFMTSTEALGCTLTGSSTTFGTYTGNHTAGTPYIACLLFNEGAATMRYGSSLDSSNIISGAIPSGDTEGDPLTLGVRRLTGYGTDIFFWSVASAGISLSPAQLTQYIDDMESLIITGA